MTRQSAFSFDWPVDLRQDNFIVSPVNHLAYETVTRSQEWPFFCAIIQGPSASGKTHLAHIFAETTGAAQIEQDNLGQPHWQMHRAYVLDDLDRYIGDLVHEEALFHLYNAAKANNDRLLLTVTADLTALPFQLPDLRSRIMGSTLVTLNLPDEELLSALYTKSFHERQILVKPDVIAYLVTHTERSFAAVQNYVQAIDQWTLATGKAVTIPVLRKFLDQDQSV